MQTDRELLEAAARAAGVDGWWEDGYLSFIKRSGGPWRPFDDDGDLLRLALALDISIEIHLDASQPLPWLRAVRRYRDAQGGYREAWEQVMPAEYNADKGAATRRAVVLLAAQIGEVQP